MKGLDVVGVALILFGVLWAVFFSPPQYESIGSYSIAELAPMIVGAIGLICVIAARFKKS